MSSPLAVAVFASGEGTTLEALAEQAAGGHVPIRIVLVLSDRPTAAVIEKARRRGLPTVVLPLRGEDAQRWTQEASQLLRTAGTSLVLLAGFLSVLPPVFVRQWEGRIINTHPALLPKFGGKGMYGDRVHAAVLAAGESETGATVHLVTEELDAGPILAQQRVPVEPGDTPETLRHRVQTAERVALYSVLGRFAEGQLPLPYRGPAGRPRSRDTDPKSGPGVSD